MYYPADVAIVIFIYMLHGMEAADFHSALLRHWFAEREIAMEAQQSCDAVED